MRRMRTRRLKQDKRTQGHKRTRAQGHKVTPDEIQTRKDMFNKPRGKQEASTNHNG